MKLGGKQKLILISLLVVIITTGLILRFWKYVLYIPPLWERLMARPATTPLEAYEKFRRELGDNNYEEALHYIIREKREQYRELLNDEEMRNHYARSLTNFTESYVTDCSEIIMCKSRAVYSYDYEIAEPYWEELLGKRFFVTAGVQTLEMTFIEIRAGYWQISEL